MDDRLAELNPKPRTCVVFGGRGFLGRSLVLRLLKLGKWIVRVADSTQSLHLDPSERDSLLSQALSSGLASLHGVDVRDKSQIITGKIFSEFLCSFVSFACLCSCLVGSCLRKCVKILEEDLGLNWCKCLIPALSIRF